MKMDFNKIAIIDYGMGNLRSIYNAIEEVGGKSIILSDSSKLKYYDKIILPGVGAFQEAMQNLNSRGFVEPLHNHVSQGKLIMGICLGMQLMCLDSLENGLHKGLGWLKAHVKPLPKSKNLPLPQMGWNSVRFTKKHQLLNGLESDCDFYFLHSYYVDCTNESDILGTTDYGICYPSMTSNNNIIGIQFHPEKSQSFGLKIIKEFISL